jgi:hypothetical protein
VKDSKNFTHRAMTKSFPATQICHLRIFNAENIIIELIAWINRLFNDGIFSFSLMKNENTKIFVMEKEVAKLC